MKKLLCMLVVFFILPDTACAYEFPPLQAYCDNYHPYNFKKDGHITGFSVELLRAIAKQAGTTIPIEVVPWKRFYKLVQKTPNTLLFTATRNADREDKFKWIGPIAERSLKLYQLVKPVKNWNIHINRSSNKASLQSIKEGQYIIGAVSGDASEINLKAQGYNVFSSPYPELNVKQLLGGRFPILSSLDLPLAMKLKMEGRSFSDVEEIAIFNDQYSYYYIVNKETDLDTVYRLQKALDILKYNGVYKRIKNKWMQ